MEKILGWAEIPEEKIRHFGKSENEKIETSSCQVHIFAKNEEDRKLLEKSMEVERN